MKIIEIKLVEDCFDGSFIKEIILDGIVVEKFILHLCKCGRFQYHRDFARPFFQVEKEGMFILKGVEGNRTLRAILYRKNIEEGLNFLREYINGYSNKFEEKGTDDFTGNC